MQVKMKLRVSLRSMLLLVAIAAVAIVLLDRIVIASVSKNSTQLLTFVVVDAKTGAPLSDALAYGDAEPMDASANGLIQDVVTCHYTDYESALRSWRVYHHAGVFTFAAPDYKSLDVDVNQFRITQTDAPPISLGVVVCLSNSEGRDGYAFRPRNFDRRNGNTAGNQVTVTPE